MERIRSSPSLQGLSRAYDHHDRRLTGDGRMMNTLNNLKTRSKLLLSSGMISLSLLVVGSMAIIGLVQLSERIETIFTINVLPLKQLGESFQSEVQPMVVDIEGRTLELKGSAEEQYAEWRQLLRELYENETGLPAGSTAAVPPGRP